MREATRSSRPGSLRSLSRTGWQRRGHGQRGEADADARGGGPICAGEYSGRRGVFEAEAWPGAADTIIPTGCDCVCFRLPPGGRRSHFGRLNGANNVHETRRLCMKPDDFLHETR